MVVLKAYRTAPEVSFLLFSFSTVRLVQACLYHLTVQLRYKAVQKQTLIVGQAFCNGLATLLQHPARFRCMSLRIK